MPTIIDSLLVKLGLDSSDFDKNKKEVDKGLKGTGAEAEDTGKKFKKTGKEGSDSFENVRKSATKFLAIIGGTMAIKSFITQTIESSAALDRLSQNLNINASTISAWSNAQEIAGGTGDGLQSTMDMLSKSQTELQLTGQSGLIPYFSALGVSMADAYGKARPVNDILLDLSDRMSGMDRTTAFNMGQMMGIDPGTLQLLLKGRTEVELMVKRQKEFSAVTKKQAEEASRLRRHLIESKQSFNAFGREILSSATPALEKVFEIFSGFGDWMRENKEFVQNFLGIIAGGFAAIGIAMTPINLTAAALVGLAFAIAALKQDYDAWKRGEDSLIDWEKWGPSIDLALEGLKKLREGAGYLIDKLAKEIVMIGLFISGDFEAAKLAAHDFTYGTSEKFTAKPKKGKKLSASQVPSMVGIPNAAMAAQGAGAEAIAAQSAPGARQSIDRSIETNIGEVKVYTQATDAEGIAGDMGKSLDYLFTSQANYGQF